MPRPQRLMVHHPGEDAMNFTALANSRALPCDRRQERVHGSHILAVDRQHLGVERLVDGIRAGHGRQHAEP